MKRNGAELIVEGLKEEGLRRVLVLSGTAVLPILDVLYHTEGMRYIQSQHEQGAMYMANGYARSAKSAAICLVSSGGVANALPGVAQAFPEPWTAYPWTAYPLQGRLIQGRLDSGCKENSKSKRKPRIPYRVRDRL